MQEKSLTNTQADMRDAAANGRTHGRGRRSDACRMQDSCPSVTCTMMEDKDGQRLVAIRICSGYHFGS